MIRILLIGKNGQLGWELNRTLATLGEVIAYDHPEIDLSKQSNVREVIRRVSPELIINAAAYTDVDKAESEPELAMAINTLAPGVIAEEAKRLEATFVHYSTDYVFDGKKGSPYVEKDMPNPLNVYGKTKLEGEQAVEAVGGSYFIFRTSWVYSLRQQSGFVSKVLRWSRQQETLRMVSDQIANPTWCRMLAEVTAQLLARGIEQICEHSGLYHLAGGGFASRYDWAKFILEIDPMKSEQKVKEIITALTSDFPTPAQRPKNTALNCQKFITAFGLYIPPWEASLRLAMNMPELVTNNMKYPPRGANEFHPQD
ncbi:MAG: dTDP-4-dehydrorhamnose reductase [Anaerolineales bacterium]